MMWSGCCSLRMPTTIPDTMCSMCYSGSEWVYWTLALSGGRSRACYLPRPFLP
jgi:hypothetical protein